MLAVTGGRALWYLTRGTGLVALVLLTLSVVLGVMTSIRWQSPRWPRFITAALHRNVSLLVLAFLAVHIVTAVVDAFAPIRWLDIVVPYGSTYRPLWLGLGALAFDLLMAVTVTSLLRQRIGYRAWRFVHWAAYACWPVALVHGLGTGSDTRLGWVLAINLACLLSVAGAVWWRLAEVKTGRERTWVGAAAASAVIPVAIVVWLVAQPLRPGWAAKAGTPSSLLARAASSGPVTSSSPVTSSGTTASMQPPFSDTLQGTIRQVGPDASGVATVTIDGTLSGGPDGVLHLVIQGPALSGGGLEMTRSSVALGPTSHPSMYQGTVVQLRGTQLVARLLRPDGTPFDVAFSLRINNSAGTVAGSVQASTTTGNSLGGG